MADPESAVELEAVDEPVDPAVLPAEADAVVLPAGLTVAAARAASTPVDPAIAMTLATRVTSRACAAG